jgi:hypothetical protein
MAKSKKSKRENSTKKDKKNLPQLEESKRIEDGQTVTRTSSPKKVTEEKNDDTDFDKSKYVLDNGGFAEPRHYTKISFLDAIFKVDEFVKVNYPVGKLYIGKIIHILHKYRHSDFPDLKDKPILLIERYYTKSELDTKGMGLSDEQVA